MTDLDKLKALLDGFGVQYSEENAPSKKRTYIICMEGAEAIGGLKGFYTRFAFDDLGAFIIMGAWE